MTVQVHKVRPGLGVGLRGLISGLLLAVSGAVGAAAENWATLSEPGVVVIMRHALAPGTGDPAAFDITKCETQRNLDERGQAQAEATGAKMRRTGVVFDEIWSSQWCRCMDTAELLGLGPVTPTPTLNSFFRDRSTEPAQTAATQDLLASQGGSVLLVTHQVNITALTGVYPKSGELLVFRRSDSGLQLIERLLLAP